jgi:hypothetical protein
VRGCVAMAGAELIDYGFLGLGFLQGSERGSVKSRP